MPPALLKPGFDTIVPIVLAYMLSTNGYRLYFSTNYLDIELLYDKVYWVVLYRSRWCYIDCGGVISITVVLYRSRCCYIDHGGVISTTVVLYRSRWCYIDLLISISIPIEAIGTILWKPGFRKGGDPVTNLDLESQSPHLIFAVHPVFKRKKMAGNAPGKKYEYRPNSSARGEDLKTRSVSNN